MGQKEKLILRLKGRPKDFTFDEAETLLKYLGYQRSDKGRTSGSRVMFFIRIIRPSCCIVRTLGRSCWLTRSAN